MRMKKSLLILLFIFLALFFAAFRPAMPFAEETAAPPEGAPVTGGRILMGTIGERPTSSLIWRPIPLRARSPGSCM